MALPLKTFKFCWLMSHISHHQNVTKSEVPLNFFISFFAFKRYLLWIIFENVNSNIELILEICSCRRWGVSQVLISSSYLEKLTRLVATCLIKVVNIFNPFYQYHPWIIKADQCGINVEWMLDQSWRLHYIVQ